MKLKIKGSIWFTMLLVATVLLFVAMSFGYSEKARQIPLLIGVPTVILGILLLMSERFPKLIVMFNIDLGDSKVAGDDKITSDEKQTQKKAIHFMGWLGAYVILVLLVGFLVAAPIIIFLYLKYTGNISWIKTLLFTVIVVGIIEYAGFEILMKADMFKGILFDAVLPPF
ncbi:tripartite tricarboxylate transporter TctB family protein [Chloroflexota bacterium]